MKRRLMALALLAALCLPLLAGCGGKKLPQGMDEEALLEAGREIVSLLNQGSYQEVYDRLRAAADRGALHHALLLTGPKGSGKGELARFIAAAMECTAPAGKPCGTCPACRKVFSGIHPDVIAVRDEGHKTLPVDTVRALCADAYIRPNEGQRKIYIFEDCGQLDSRCQDILLKTVEEGPRYAAFLFLSENAAAILPTIRSRCVELKLRAADETEDANSAMTDRALELGDCLCQLREDVLTAYLCSLEGAKLTRADLTAFLSASRDLCAAAGERESVRQTFHCNTPLTKIAFAEKIITH